MAECENTTVDTIHAPLSPQLLLHLAKLSGPGHGTESGLLMFQLGDLLQKVFTPQSLSVVIYKSQIAYIVDSSNSIMYHMHSICVLIYNFSSSKYHCTNSITII